MFGLQADEFRSWVLSLRCCCSMCRVSSVLHNVTKKHNLYKSFSINNSLTNVKVNQDHARSFLVSRFPWMTLNGSM